MHSDHRGRLVVCAPDIRKSRTGRLESNPRPTAWKVFNERRVTIQPIAPGEIGRFVDRFGLGALLNSEGKAYIDAGMKYLRPSEAQLLEKIEREPNLLRLPLIRSANRLSIGQDEGAWKAMLIAAS